MLLLFWRLQLAATVVTARATGRVQASGAKASATTVALRGGSRLDAVAAAGSQTAVVLRATGRGAAPAVRGAVAVVLVRASGRLAPDAIHQAAAVVALRVRGTGASTATALQFQVSAPVADLADGSWTTQLGSAVDLYASIDEQIPDGADYIQSSLSPLVVDQCRVLLAPLDDPGTTGNHTLRVMFKKDDLAGDRIDLTVTLYAHDGTTAIAVGAEPNIQDVVTVEVSILPTQAALLTPADYEQGLILEFSAVKV